MCLCIILFIYIIAVGLSVSLFAENQVQPQLEVCFCFLSQIFHNWLSGTDQTPFSGHNSPRFVVKFDFQADCNPLWVEKGKSTFCNLFTGPQLIGYLVFRILYFVSFILYLAARLFRQPLRGTLHHTLGPALMAPAGAQLPHPGHQSIFALDPIPTPITIFDLVTWWLISDG